MVIFARFPQFAHSAPGILIHFGPLAYSTPHCSANFDVCSGELAHAQGRGPAARCEPPGHGSFLPVFYHLLIPLRAFSFFLGP